MVWSPQDLERLVREQVRVVALANQAIAKKPLRLDKRLWKRVARLWSDPVHFWLWAGALVPALLAATLLVEAWPPGGGQEESSLAVAQGASLIFVVILVGLMSGPIEAGRRLGRGTDWVARDGLTWLGLGWVAVLSLALLAIGWAKPERREELATIAVTASGLGATGLVARRLLRLSDPAAQLEDLFVRSIERVRAVLATDRKETDEALKLADVEKVVSTSVSRFASQAAQQQAAFTLQAFTTVAAFAWREGDWPLAVRAQYYATMIAREYLLHVEAADGSDHVVMTLVNETDDLHEVAGGPAGRKLSQALVTSLSQLGREIALRKEFVVGGRSEAVFPIVYELGTTMLGRRLADQKSVDPAAAIRGLGDIAAGCAESGAVWSAISSNERLLECAAAATNTNVVHVASPAWEESLRVILAIAKRIKPDDSSLIFKAALRDFEQGLDKVEHLAPWSTFSSLGPILRSATDGSHATLQVSFYALWTVEERNLKALVEFGRHVAYKLTSLLKTAPDRSRGSLSHDVGEVMYQWIAAAATRANDEPLADKAHQKSTDSIANILGWLRSLIVNGGVVQEDHDLDELLHMYVSGWEMLLYLLRDASGLSGSASRELEDFLGALTDVVLSEMPEEFRATLHLLGDWLEKVGAREASARAIALSQRIPEPAPSTWGPLPRANWGMGEEYFTRRGGLIAAVESDVEAYFRGDV